jgi:hypothetical protein
LSGGDEKRGFNSVESTIAVSSTEYRTANGPVVRTIRHDSLWETQGANLVPNRLGANDNSIFANF